MPTRSLFNNAVFSAIEVATIGASYFLLMKLMLGKLGAEQLGVWSIVMATTSVGKMSNAGFSQGIVKFVAKYGSTNDMQAVSRLVATALVTAVACVATALSCLWWFSHPILEFFVGEQNVHLAISILPLAMSAAVLSVVSAILLGCLNGLERFDIKCGILIAGAAAYLFLSTWLADRWGLVGLASAQVIQYLVIVLSAGFYVRRLTGLDATLFRWNRHHFKEMLGYGLNFQFVQFLAMLFDPLTKGLISRFGELSSVTYYEMASRMTMQLRGLIVLTSQVLVPRIANLYETAPHKIQQLYCRSLSVLTATAIPFFAVIACLMPLISHLWIGRYEPSFVFAGICTTFGWFINSLAAPAYFAFLGIGRMRWVVTAHATIAVVILILGTMLGYAFGTQGVVVSVMIGLSLGSLVVLVSYHFEHGIGYSPIVTKQNVFLLMVFSVLVPVVLTYCRSRPDSAWDTWICVVISASICGMAQFVGDHNILGEIATRLRSQRKFS